MISATNVLWSDLTIMEYSVLMKFYIYGVLGTMERLWEVSHKRSIAPQAPTVKAIIIDFD